MSDLKSVGIKCEKLKMGFAHDEDDEAGKKSNDGTIVEFWLYFVLILF